MKTQLVFWHTGNQTQKKTLYDNGLIWNLESFFIPFVLLTPLLHTKMFHLRTASAWNNSTSGGDKQEKKKYREIFSMCVIILHVDLRTFIVSCTWGIVMDIQQDFLL